MKAVKPLNNYDIYHINFESQFYVTSSFIRIQEFYESPNYLIKNNYFTLEKLIHEYAIENGNHFDYFTRWAGFNIPGEILYAFSKKFKGNLSEKEIDIFNCIMPLVNSREDKEKPFYLIGTFNDHDINHELAHGLYYLDNDYKTKMDKLTVKLDDNIYSDITDELLTSGYSEEVLLDEIQAYLSTSSLKEIKEMLGIKLTKKDIIKYKEIFNEFV